MDGWTQASIQTFPYYQYIILSNGHNNDRRQMIEKCTSNPSAFELSVFQVLPEVSCAQSPAYHEQAQ